MEATNCNCGPALTLCRNDLKAAQKKIAGLCSQLQTVRAERDRWLKRVRLLEKREAMIRNALETRA